MATDLKSRSPRLTLTRFSRGKDNGQGLQVTENTGMNGENLAPNFRFVHLTREEAATLARDLLEFAAGEERGAHEDDADLFSQTEAVMTATGPALSFKSALEMEGEMDANRRRNLTQKRVQDAMNNE